MADANITISANTRNAEAAFRRLDARLARIERTTSRVERRNAAMSRSLGSVARSASQVSGALGAATAALAAFATGAGIRGIINATTTFEGFRAQLTAYLGDQRRANAELARLEELAKGLPQSLTDLTNGFTILTRYGINTSNESMKAFANIASANNKTLSQLGEALGDALTGEYERLKEFGVKVTRENGQLTAKMGDQVLGVASNATDLMGMLRSLGEEGGRYFGAAENQANTLTGALSRLGDSVDKAARAIGEGGLAKTISQIADRFSSFLDQNKELAMELGEKLSVAAILAADAFEILLKNIEYVMIAIGALIGLGVLKFLFSLASMILGPVIGAFKLFYNVLKGVATFMVRNLVRGSIAAVALAFGKIALVIGAVGTAVYGVGWLIDKVFGTDVTGTLENFASNVQETVVDAIDGVTELGSEAIDTLMDTTGATAMLSQGQELLNGKYNTFAEYLDDVRARASANRQAQEEVTDAMSEQERQIAATADETRRLQEAEEARASAVTKAADEIIKKQDEQLQALRLEASLIAETDAVREAHLSTLAAEIKFRQDNTNATDDEVEAFRRRYAAKADEIAQAKDELQYQQALLRARRDLLGIQTRAESVQRGVGVIGRLDEAGQLQKNYQMDQNALQSSLDAKLISEEQYQQALYALKQEYADKANQLYINQVQNEQRQRQTAIQAEQMRLGKTAEQAETYADFMMKTDAEKAQFAISQGALMFNELGKYNKDAFEAAKAFNIAQAIMNTYMGATKALASYPPPFNFIAAAAVVAMGLSQVAQIRSQTYSGRSLGGPVMGGKSYIVGENGPELFSPTSTGSITRNGDIGKGGETSINFTIVANDSQGFDDLLIQRQGMIKQMISDAMIERGQRSMV